MTGATCLILVVKKNWRPWILSRQQLVLDRAMAVTAVNSSPYPKFVWRATLGVDPPSGHVDHCVSVTTSAGFFHFLGRRAEACFLVVVLCKFIAARVATVAVVADDAMIEVNVMGKLL